MHGVCTYLETLLETAGTMAVIYLIRQTDLWCKIWLLLFTSYEVLHMNVFSA